MFSTTDLFIDFFETDLWLIIVIVFGLIVSFITYSVLTDGTSALPGPIAPIFAIIVGAIGLIVLPILIWLGALLFEAIVILIILILV